MIYDSSIFVEKWIVDTDAKIPPKMNKKLPISRFAIFTKVNFIKIEITQSVFNIFALNILNRFRIEYQTYCMQQYLIKVSKNRNIVSIKAYPGVKSAKILTFQYT